MEELLDNLLFSATLPAVAFPKPGSPPSPAERIVHNAARRRLAERYGSDEYLALADLATTRCFARKNPWVLPMVLTGVGLWNLLMRSARLKSN